MYSLYQNISEALVQLADNRDQLLFGNVVIMAGGAGSGKGLVVGNLIDVQGKVFDVDNLKKVVAENKRFQKIIYDMTGEDVSSYNLRNPEDVGKLHRILNDEMELDRKIEKAAFSSLVLAPEDRKPNLIFDVTLKNMKKLQEISSYVMSMGYKKENIHIVWVLTELEDALKNNRNRKRVVDEDLLKSIHMNVAATMDMIIGYGESVNKYFDGKFYIVFNNQLQNDLELLKSDIGGFYIKDATYVKLKDRNKPIQKLSKDILTKVKDYTNQEK